MVWLNIALCYVFSWQQHLFNILWPNDWPWRPNQHPDHWCTKYSYAWCWFYQCTQQSICRTRKSMWCIHVQRNSRPQRQQRISTAGLLGEIAFPFTLLWRKAYHKFNCIYIYIYIYISLPKKRIDFVIGGIMSNILVGRVIKTGIITKK